MTAARYLALVLLVAALLLHSIILACVATFLGICCFLNADFELHGP